VQFVLQILICTSAASTAARQPINLLIYQSTKAAAQPSSNPCQNNILLIENLAVGLLLQATNLQNV